jgi:hypothetical protein
MVGANAGGGAGSTCEPVTASGDDGNVPANVLDGDLNTRWSANGDGQWIQLCLGDTVSVSGVQIAFYNGNNRTSTFDIQTSNNGSSWSNAATGRVSSGTSLNLETFTFTARQAKYVRILGHGNSVNAWNSYTEVKVQRGSSSRVMKNSVAGEMTLGVSPNPFGEQANIQFTLPDGGKTYLAVYDMSGKVVAVLVDANMAAGRYAVDFKSDHVSGGVYVVRLQHNGRVSTRKVQKL